MKQTILITGGAGYLGSILTRELLEAGFRVVVADDLLFGGESLLGVWGQPFFRFIRVNITDFSAWQKFFETEFCYGIVHLAAIVGDPACAKQPELTRKVNLEGLRMLLELARQHGVERFVFASTCSNYGKMADVNAYMTEESNLAPVSLYAELKVAAEKLLLSEKDPVSIFCPTSLRFATLYGVSPRMRFDLTVNEFTKELALGRELTVFGEQFWRPYCHVSDCARAICLVLESERKKVADEVFNVGETKENYTKTMLVSELKTFFPQLKVKYLPKYEDSRDYRVSFEKIKKQLGFFTSKTVKDGIREIKTVLTEGIISDPDSRKYYNVYRPFAK